MFITWQTIITAGAVFSAVLAIVGALLKIHGWILRQELQNKTLEELKKHHEKDLKRVREENTLICFALSACLDGLQQLGANHTVPLAKEKLDKHLNEEAHKY
ncbi:MAG: hypothetical protein E7616_10175 [Ruminococcaceae bacterium]|nr:hypothetical protein [Oscillospiraceae bacterium]